MDLVKFEWCSQWDVTDQLHNRTFSLPHFKLAKYEHTMCNGSTNFTCVKALFLLARHPDFHILHTYIPTVLIVILSWMSFWIKPDATPARVTLGVTSILTMATQYSQSTQNLPPVSYIKSLDIWMITCMVYVFMALLEFALVYRVYNACNPDPLYPSSNNNTTTAAGHTITAQCIVMSPRPPSNSLLRAPGELLLLFLEGWRRFWSTAEAIDRASRYFFPLTYGLFILGYFSLLMHPLEQEAVSTDIPN